VHRALGRSGRAALRRERIFFFDVDVDEVECSEKRLFSTTIPRRPSACFACFSCLGFHNVAF